MQEILDLVSSYNIEIVAGLVVATAFALLASMVNGIRISALKRKNKKLNEILKLSNGDSIENSLIDAISVRRDYESEIEKIGSEIAEIKFNLSNAVQKVGFIRYNAFGDMGSDLSFSIALLDEKQNGVVITSIYGREDSNVYAKPIKEGSSSYKLSVEEIQALDRAKQTSSFESETSKQPAYRRSKEKLAEKKAEEATESSSS